MLAAHRPVLPDPAILKTTQDRLIEKDFVKNLGIATADYVDVSSAAELTRRRGRSSGARRC